MNIPLPAAVNELGDMVLRVLAVAGAVFVGGFGLGLLSQLIARLTVTKPLPKPALNLLRGLGGITLGLIVYLWIFGHGGPGFGLGGAFGLGGGGDKGTAGEGSGKETVSAKETNRRGEDPTTGPDVIRIEVLGDQIGERERFYRMEGTKERLNASEVRARVRERQNQSPSLRALVIVLYDDSPDQQKRQVTDLEDIAAELKNLRSIIEKVDGKAPKIP
jgi:hypothetical protein